MSTKQFGLALLGILLAIILVYVSIPNPGKKAIQREQAALGDVNSWRINMQISRNGMLVIKRVHEAACPDKEHITERSPEADAEYIRIGNDVYYRKNSSTWTMGRPGPDLFFPLPTPRPCLTDPDQSSTQPPGGAEEMRLTLQNDIEDGKIEKGEVRQVNAAPCQEWTVTTMSTNNRLGSYTTCLGEADFLPRYIQAANQNFNIYFDWDVPITVHPPNLSGAQ